MLEIDTPWHQACYPYAIQNLDALVLGGRDFAGDRRHFITLLETGYDYMLGTPAKCCPGRVDGGVAAAHDQNVAGRPVSVAQVGQSRNDRRALAGEIQRVVLAAANSSEHSAVLM